LNVALDPIALKTLAIELAAAMPPATAAEIDYPAVDVSPRALKMTRAIRIAQQYNWPDAIPHFLQSRGVAFLSDLSDAQLDDLVDRMDGYVDAAMTGCSLADCLPAL
jgi:hypothetical protein